MGILLPATTEKAFQGASPQMNCQGEGGGQMGTSPSQRAQRLQREGELAQPTWGRATISEWLESTLREESLW